MKVEDLKFLYPPPLQTNLMVYWFPSVCVSLSVCVSVCPSVRLYAYLSVSLSACLSVCLSPVCVHDFAYACSMDVHSLLII